MNSFKTILFLMFISVVNPYAYGQLFTEEPTIIDDFLYPSIDWADYDGDGDTDIVISGAVDTTGDGSADTSTIKIYNNELGSFTEAQTPTIYGLHLGFVKFIDIDNDGDMDLLTNGQNYDNITQYFFTVYENTGTGFSEKQQLEGAVFASIDYGDYDNDGDLDLLVTGAYQATSGASVLTRIYSNDNGTFTYEETDLPPVQNGNAKFGDFDMDQDLDVVIMGLDADAENMMAIFENNEGVFTEKQTLLGISYGSISIVDFDVDGDLDISVIGNDPNYDYTTLIYENKEGTFSEFTALIGLDNFSGTNPIQWGDFDNDGDFDLIISGDDPDYIETTLFYENTNNSFAVSEVGLINIGGGTSLSLADFNNDNKLDISLSGFLTDEFGEYIGNTSVLKNIVAVENLNPEPPQNLTATYIDDTTLQFSWDNGTDDITPQASLKYFLTVGTTENGSEIASYIVCGNSWTIKNVAKNNYFWSVQSIDGASVFSEKASNSILNSTDFNEQPGFSMYPNPSSGKVTIALAKTLTEEKASIHILNSLGVHVRSMAIDNTHAVSTLDFSELQTGVYIIQYISEKYTISKKLILN